MKFTIPTIIFVIAIGVLTIWLTFLTTKGGLTNNTKKGFIKKLTKRGRITGFVLLCIFLLLIGQEANNQNLASNQELTLKKERDIRDASITHGIKQGVDSASSKLFNDVSRAFANQNLKIDTLRKTIVDLRYLDRVTNNYNVSDKDPTILINTEDGITLAKNHYRVEIESNAAGSTNFNINCYLLIELNDGRRILEKPQIFFPEAKIMTKMYAPLTTTTKNINEFYLYMTGEYSNMSISKNYTIDFLYRYNPKEGKTWGMVGPSKKLILDIIDSLNMEE